jgi:2-polyprenyl-6-hydroxyphenyl methylase/3-demethylubiquinone-9 3-methyltransferase
MLSRDQLDQPWDKNTIVDPREIERFAALAEEWWKPEGKFKTIHDFNAQRVGFIQDKIATHFGIEANNGFRFEGIDILDVGCGAGLVSEPLAAKGANVVGIDATAKNIEIARNHAAQFARKVDYRHCLSSHVVETGVQFDVVLNLEVIEHVANPGQLMLECCHLLKPGGIMIIGTLNRTVRSFLLAIVAAEYIIRWLPVGTHDWRRFFRPKEIIGMLVKNGLVNCQTTGLVYNLIVKRWRLSTNYSVNYLLVAEKNPPAHKSLDTF